ncbi:MAG: hypothetical protein IPO37_10295 [Saprospiraceae bacterium]|nr:hypothetical protein [Saprospiraceae bacterium]
MVFQFSVRTLVIGSIVTYQQMRFVDKMDPGFKKEGVFTFNVDTEYKSRNATFKVKLKELKDVSYSTFGNDDPASDNEWEANFTYDKRPKDEGFNAHLKLADAEYLNTYGMEVVAGTPYEEQDTLRKLIVNEYMVKKLGLTDPRDIIGKTITVGGWDPVSVRDVIKDFHIGTQKDHQSCLDYKGFQYNIKLERPKIAASSALG